MGSRVKLTGLSRQDLNDRCGVCEKQLPQKGDSDSCRFQVRLDDGKVLSVKGVNIVEERAPAFKAQRCHYHRCEKKEAAGQPLFKKCALCKQVRYCCREHQVADWRHGHKEECSRLAECKNDLKPWAKAANHKFKVSLKRDAHGGVRILSKSDSNLLAGEVAERIRKHNQEEVFAPPIQDLILMVTSNSNEPDRNQRKSRSQNIVEMRASLSVRGEFADNSLLTNFYINYEEVLEHMLDRGDITNDELEEDGKIEEATINFAANCVLSFGTEVDRLAGSDTQVTCIDECIPNERCKCHGCRMFRTPPSTWDADRIQDGMARDKKARRAARKALKKAAKIKASQPSTS